MKIMMMRAGILLACGVICGVTLTGAHRVHAQAHDKDGHMLMTTLHPVRPGDQARADAIVVAARKVAERYVDYQKALTDGYDIFLPNQKQSVYHFVLDSANKEAMIRFDPTKPAALLYERIEGSTPGYKLVGVMYTDSFGASEEELNERIPLSIAQWHKHVNMCVPPQQQGDWLFGNPRFGLSGSITTEAACTAAGGSFKPHLSGWMTHVYPFEKDPAKIWQAAGKGDDHGEMHGMKM